jgi:hypothetical protein
MADTPVQLFNWNGSLTKAQPVIQWPLKPIPLRDDERQRKDFPEGALTSKIRCAVVGIEDIIDVPDTLAVQSCLSGAAFAVQGLACIINPNTKANHPLSLYCVTVADSGERKTAADNKAFKAAYKFEERLAGYRKSMFGEYDVVMKAWNAEKKTIERAKVSFLERTELLKKLGPPPELPLSATLVYSDFTTEGIYKNFKYGYPSQGIFADEAGIVVGGHAFRDETKLHTITTLNNLWGGAPFSRVRTDNTDSEKLYDKRLTVHLMMQPGVAAQFNGHKEVRNTGLDGRILFANPISKIGDHDYNKLNSAMSELHIDAFNAEMTNKLKYLFSHFQQSNNKLISRPIELNEQAKELWRDYGNSNSAKVKSGEHRPITSFSEKMAEHALRIAGVNEVFEDSGVVEINAEMMERACAITDFYATELLNSYKDNRVSELVIGTEKVLKYLQEEWEEQYFTARIIQRKFHVDKTKAMMFLKKLEKHYYAQPVPYQVEVMQDGKTTKTNEGWILNPYCR